MKIDTKRLRRKIAAHVRAQIELAFKGVSIGPDDSEIIKSNAKTAKRNLDAYINTHLDAPNFIGRLRRIDDVPEKSGRYVVLHKGMIAADAYYNAEPDSRYPAGWSQYPKFLPTHWLDAPGMFDGAPHVSHEERVEFSAKALTR